MLLWGLSVALTYNVQTACAKTTEGKMNWTLGQLVQTSFYVKAALVIKEDPIAEARKSAENLFRAYEKSDSSLFSILGPDEGLNLPIAKVAHT